MRQSRVTGGIVIMAVRVRDVWLDYREAGSDRKLLENVSGICWSKPFLWTVSDEGRTFERQQEPRNERGRQPRRPLLRSIPN
jgi:hypothetical protein